MKKIRKLLAVLFTAGITAGNMMPAAAEELPSGLDYEDLEDELEDYVDDLEDDMAALGVSVFTADKVLYSGTFGLTDRQYETAADENTVFDWGPVSQVLVWTSAMQLKEEGKLDLNADVRTYLPEEFRASLKFEKPVSMTDLMNHTGGFEELFIDTHESSISMVLPLDQALLRHQPDQVYEPGTVTAQSDWGAALAGYVVQCISGQDYYDYVRAHILEPLGMKNTAVKPDLSDVEGMALRRMKMKCYTAKMAEIADDYFISVLYPSGSAVGTPDDFRVFMQALLPGSEGSAKLFSDPQTAEEMLSGSDFYETSGLPKNSHGLWNLLQSVPVIGIRGITMGCTSSFAYDPQSGIAVCIMTNVQGETDFNQGIMDMVFGKSEDAEIQRDAYPSGKFMTANTIYTGPLRLFSYRAAKLSDDEITDGYWETTADGAKLEQPYSDYLKVPASLWMRQDLLVAWFSLAFVMAIGCLILWVWPLPGRINTKEGMMRWYDLTGKIGHVVVLILIASMMMSLQLASLYYDTRYFGIVFPLLGVLAGILAVLLVLNLYQRFRLKGQPFTKLQTIFGILRPIMWIGVIVNVLYWQLYALSLL